MRVSAGMDVLEGADADVGVDLGGVEPGMAEHGLNVADVGAAFEHVGGATVAEEVAGPGFADMGAFHHPGDPGAEKSFGEAGAVAAEEEAGFGGKVSEDWPGFVEVALEPAGGTGPDRKHPVLAALAAADVQGLQGGIKVAEIEAGHFGAADAGGVEKFEDYPVAQAKRAREVGELKQAGDFRLAEGFGKVARLLAWQVEVGGWVGREHAGAAQPGEEAPDTSKPGELAIGGERLLGARRAVVEQKQLVLLKQGPGEWLRAGKSARIGPADKLLKRPMVGLHPAGRIAAGAQVLKKPRRQRVEVAWIGASPGNRGRSPAFGSVTHAL